MSLLLPPQVGSVSARNTEILFDNAVEKQRLASMYHDVLETRGQWWPWVAHLNIIGTTLFQNLSTGLAEEVV